MSHLLEIRLLGAFSAEVGGTPIPHLTRKAGYQLLVLLALKDGAAQSRTLLSGLLWPESDEAKALFYLRRTLSEVRAAMGKAGEAILSPTPRTLALDRSRVNCDLWNFREAAGRHDFASAVARYAGPLLEGWTDDWLLAERDACERSFLECLEASAMSARNTREAVNLLRRVVTTEPGRESAWRALMEELAGLGEVGELTLAYRRLRVYLRDEARVEPSRETRECFERLRDEVRRRATVRRLVDAPQKQLEVPAREPERTRLPSPRTALVGRIAEIQRVKELLGKERLVTLVGIGGVGKTRLALAALHEYDVEAENDVWWVDLSTTTDDCRVGAAIAEALNLPEETLAQRLSSRTGILALDNCEQVLSGAAAFVDSVLEVAPSLKVLATSREPLGVPGETVWRVPTLAANESVALFLDRAQRIRPDWVVTPERAATIAGICRRLDDIALAIELATALLSSLTVDEIAARLDERFELLRYGARTLQARQQTLEAAMDWSWELLSDSERTLLGSLTVFFGGWNLEAAESVCGPRVLPSLRALVEKSLVVHDVGNGRYRLLETVREYARIQFAPERAERTRQRHGLFFQALAERATERRSSTLSARTMRLLDADHDNLRAAFDWALSSQPSVALGLAGTLWPFWRERGFRSEARRRLAEALEAAPAETPGRQNSLLGQGFLCYDFDDYDGALANLDAASDLAGLRADAWCQAEALRGRGLVLWNRGDSPGARECYDGALERFARLDRKDGIAATLAALGHLAWNLGDLETATRRNLECQRLFRELDDEAGLAETASHLGLIARSVDDFPQARQHFLEALEIRERLGFAAGIATIQHHLGVVAFCEGSLDEATERLTRSVESWRELGDRGWESNSLNYLGLVHRDRGDLENAEKTLLEALSLRRKTTASRAVAGLLFALGGVALLRGDAALARDRFAESVALRHSLGLREGTVEALSGLAASLAELGERACASASLDIADSLAEGAVFEGAERFAQLARASLGARERAEPPDLPTIAELLARLT